MAHCKEITVDRLVVEDPASRSRIEITGSSIMFFDRRKKLRALLELHQPWDDAPRLEFYDLNECERLSLTLEGSGSPMLHLQDGNGMDRVSLHILDDGTPFISLNDALGTPRMELTAHVDEGTPRLAFNDRQKKARMVLMSDEEEQIPALTIYDEQGKQTWHAPTKKEA